MKGRPIIGDQDKVLTAMRWGRRTAPSIAHESRLSVGRARTAILRLLGRGSITKERKNGVTEYHLKEQGCLLAQCWKVAA